MSLQDAANYFNQRRNSPVERGLEAGRAAYEGTRAPSTPLRSGIGAVPIADVKSSVQQALEQSARQRQVLADTAQKQALGLYPNTGTSAAAYDYLRGRPGAKYPVNPVLAGQPGSALTSPTISKPYEEATTPGRITQTGTSQAAKDTPSKMPTVSYGPIGVRQPGLLDSLLGLAMPAYLGYKGYQYLSGLGGAPASTLAMSYPQAVSALQAYEAGLPAAAAVEAPGVQAILDSAYSTPGVQVASTDATSGLSSLPSGGGEAGAGATTADLSANLPALSAEAGEIGYVWDGSQLVPATADQIAAASAEGTWAGTAADATAAATTGASSYIPYIAAALAADKLTGGAVSKAGQQTIDVAKKGLEQVADLGQQAISGLENAGQQIVNWVSRPSISIGGYRIGKDGGLPQDFKQKEMAMGGLSAAADHYNLGGYSDGGRLLKGPGDGVSDSIPATIGKNRQPARLADGEFVVPARIVSELGNGSTEAGARKLYAMMDRIQASRKKSIGKGRVAVNNRADKYLPK